MIAKSCWEFSLSEPTTLVAISGSGNVAQYAALKCIELGSTVLSLSDSKGTLLAPKEGFTASDINRVAALKLRGGSLSDLSGEEKKAEKKEKEPESRSSVRSR